jgi:hypothetical protein
MWRWATAAFVVGAGTVSACSASSAPSSSGGDGAETGEAGGPEVAANDGAAHEENDAGAQPGAPDAACAAAAGDVTADVATIDGGALWSCQQAACPDAIRACAADCACNRTVLGALACSADGGVPLTCLGPLRTLGATDGVASTLVSCLAAHLLTCAAVDGG